MVAKRGVLDNSLYRRQAVYTQISLFYAFSYIFDAIIGKLLMLLT
jgi:hypothetical protein